VYNWLNTLIAFREARDEHVRAKKAAGKDEDELDDVDEPEEGEERDPEEDVVRAAELEEKKRREAEAAANAAEDNVDPGDVGGAD